MAFLGRMAARFKALASCLKSSTTETKVAAFTGTYCEAGFARYWKKLCARNPNLTCANQLFRMTPETFQRHLQSAYNQSQLDAQAAIDELKLDADNIFRDFNRTRKQVFP